MEQQEHIDLCDEQREELFALVNMVGYAREISASLGVTSAAYHLLEAKKALVAELELELRNVLSQDAIVQVAATQAGRC